MSFKMQIDCFIFGVIICFFGSKNEIFEVKMSHLGSKKHFLRSFGVKMGFYRDKIEIFGVKNRFSRSFEVKKLFGSRIDFWGHCFLQKKKINALI